MVFGNNQHPQTIFSNWDNKALFSINRAADEIIRQPYVFWKFALYEQKRFYGQIWINSFNI